MQTRTILASEKAITAGLNDGEKPTRATQLVLRSGHMQSSKTTLHKESWTASTPMPQRLSKQTLPTQTSQMHRRSHLDLNLLSLRFELRKPSKLIPRRLSLFLLRKETPHRCRLHQLHLMTSGLGRWIESTVLTHNWRHLGSLLLSNMSNQKATATKHSWLRPFDVHESLQHPCPLRILLRIILLKIILLKIILQHVRPPGERWRRRSPTPFTDPQSKGEAVDRPLPYSKTLMLVPTLLPPRNHLYTVHTRASHSKHLLQTQDQPHPHPSPLGPRLPGVQLPNRSLLTLFLSDTRNRHQHPSHELIPSYPFQQSKLLLLMSSTAKRTPMFNDHQNRSHLKPVILSKRRDAQSPQSAKLCVNADSTH